MKRLSRFVQFNEKEFSKEDFRFDRDGHAYFLNGQRIAGVTEILKSVGFIDDRYFTEEAAARGTAVHMACQYWLEGVLDEESVHPVVKPYLNGFVEWHQTHVTRSFLAERPMYDPIRRVGGTMDILVRLKGGPYPVLVDIKTGAVEYWAAYQTAAYTRMVQAFTNNIHIDRAVLSLTSKGGHSMIDFSDFKDFGVWDSAVACHYAKQNGRS